MRNQLLTIFLVSFVCPLMIQTSSAQIALEMEPIEAKSVITNVTLYRNRASITRTTSLDLDAGGYAIFFRDIPEVAYLDSVQARVSNGSLLSVETSSRPIVVDNSKLITELLAEIEGIKIKLVQTEATSESIQLQISMLKTLIEKATNDKISPVDLETFSAQITFIGDRMKNLAIEKTNNTKETEELQKHLRNAMQRKQLISVTRKKQINAVIDIGVVRAGTVEVQLTYIVYNASWSPTYAVRANAQGNEITIDYDALLTQKTGENWTNVALTLSTAQPQQSITPPMPTPWYVDIYQPASPSSAPRTKTMGGDAIYDAAYLGDDSALQMRHSEKNMGVAEASAAASVVNDGPAVSFVLPRTVTVPSNASDAQTTSIATIETSAEHFLIAVPMLTDQVFIRSEVTNKSDYILLPGKASIFHSGDYVGKTFLSTVTPNETFSLDLGIEPTVTASRTLIEKTTTSTGLFNSGKQSLYEYQISISNGNDSTIDVRVFDRIPISRNEEIEVQLKNVSSPLSTDAVYLKTDRPQGILRWDLTIPANKTGDQSFMLTWQEEVARGKDIEITPLPE